MQNGLAGHLQITWESNENESGTTLQRRTFRSIYESLTHIKDYI
jgi:hypothetical protein